MEKKKSIIFFLSWVGQQQQEAVIWFSKLVKKCKRDKKKFKVFIQYLKNERSEFFAKIS